MTTNPPDKIDRLENLVESLIRSSENLLIASERNQTQISTLATVAQQQQQRVEQVAREHEQRLARQDALIEHLDAILERLVYRQGRNDE